jgi:hypothetical protein
MEIASYTPNLTQTEVERFWMTPVEVCRLAAVGEESNPKVKKMLNTLSDRGHIPFVKSGTAKTSPRLYSLASAAMLRTIFEITRDGRAYVYAVPVAEAIRKTLCKMADEVSDLGELDIKKGSARIVFKGIRENGEPASVKWVTGDVGGGLDFSYSVFDGGYLIFRICMAYADFWADDIRAKEINV